MPAWDWVQRIAQAASGEERQSPPWPFPLRPSLVALAEPRIADDIVLGVVVLVVAVALAVVAWRFRRRRWPLLIAVLATTTAAMAAPRLGPLLVPAYPTSYFTSPTGFAAASIARGEVLYAAHCRSCHGADGHGDGPEAARQPVPPADLTAEHLWDHADGDMFWWLGHGIDGMDGLPVMPGMAERLSDGDIWTLIDFVHANAAGADLVGAGRWVHTVFAPGFTATCADGGTLDLAQLRGRPVRVVAVGDGLMVEALDPGALPSGGCTARDAAVWTAYAVVAGLRSSALAGGQFLIGREGWLLAYWPEGRAPPSETLAVLADSLRDVCAAPTVVHAGARHR